MSESDPWTRKGKTRKQSLEGFPVESPLAATSQRVEPDTSGLVKEAQKAAEVARQPIIRVVSAQHLAEPSVLIRNGRMHPALGLLPERIQLGGQPFAVRLSLNHKASVPSPPTVVSEAQERERFRPLLPSTRSCERWHSAELDQACLVRMKRQLELRQPLLEVF
jgi:hypothetical protein